MLSRLGLLISRLFHRIVPDPFIIAILLTFLTAALALSLGFRGSDASLPARASTLADAWGAGIWDLLKFGMQMCLILVTGHALASSRPIRRLLASLASIPRSGAQAAALVALVACLAGVINWGLGLIVGAILARDAGRSAHARGIPVHYPLLAAAGYLGLLVFHGGLSASAPLAMSTPANARAVLRPEHLEILRGQAIPLDQTLGSTLNLVVTGGLILGLPILFALLAPRRTQDCLPPAGPAHPDIAAEPAPADRPGPIPDWLERTPWLVWGLAAILALAVARFILNQGPARIGLDQVNAAMFALGLLCHGSARSYLVALEEAATGCAGIIIQFPIYAGIMAMMSVSGLTLLLSQGMTAGATKSTMPALTFFAATLVGLFVPSGGAQWSIQGPVALRSGLDMGVDPGAMVMAVAYGDQLANMLQPFWALPLLAITGVRARDIVGYTAIAMAAAGLWTTLGLLIL